MMDLNLVDDAFVVLVDELDGILDRNDVIATFGIDDLDQDR